ncbi:MarR family transcriptional regulator [Candidatus Peribacteria bacterium]|nr:MAG: MarR family transcriptional regulator [Candidatus Peribacteria bacterium]
MNPVQKPVDRIINSWMDITRLMRQQMRGMKKDFTVNPVQIHALIIIKEHDALTMKEFADFLHITSPSATSMVNRFVKMKWVKRVADRTNRKLVRLKLTEDGLQCVTTTMKQHTHMMRDLFSLLTVSDQKDFARILGNLHGTLAKQAKKS